jgi:hypothetical protein
VRTESRDGAHYGSVHSGRLTSLEAFIEPIARVRDPNGSLYVDLKAYKANPSADAKAQLERRFDRG